ncbi:MAG: ferrochelatase [Dokdonella sp.]|uniref:ferrochelatase n=2 Tax=Dokdonella sp. TaxID=2291710 RepID=UPI002B68AA3A|nr:ferrochelatase [Xanthomonadales bacterium]HQW76999.1 ferrochelatase [Dokdonella sp.]HQY54656.1 ferrochelatase [Dokdonella sp.]
MSRFLSFSDPEQPRRLAILLVNLGTPDAPDSASVRRYLAEFLADPRIVEQPRWLWWLILHGIILRIRPARSARAYAKVWTSAGSPLQAGTQELADRLQDALQADFGNAVIVRHAMRYGAPDLGETLAGLARSGMRRLLVVPLFPQFSATTTASVFDAVTAQFRRWRCPPELRLVSDYCQEPAHVEALARSVERHWQANGRSERLLLSFHGIPQRYVRNGDPYRQQCEATAAGLRARLRMGADELLVSFQSRVGREPWLQPYTDHTLAELPVQGVRSVDVMCPGFAVDCLETLEEMDMAGREIFLHAGGERFNYIACLNAGDDQVAAMRELVLRHCRGWPESDDAAHVRP